VPGLSSAQPAGRRVARAAAAPDLWSSCCVLVAGWRDNAVDSRPGRPT